MSNSEVNIDADVNIDGGLLSIEVTTNHVIIEFNKLGETYVIEDSYGVTFDWSYYYQNPGPWKRLSGAALESAEKRMVKEYMIATYKEIINDGSLEECRTGGED